MPADGVVVKRPAIVSRHSSGASTATPRSPADSLSTSQQTRTRTQRHLVGARGRVHSYTRNASSRQLQKLLAPPDEDPTHSNKPEIIKRNSSNVHITRNHSSTALRKNHSETSLKRNKSGAQLAALTKLTRPANPRPHGKTSKSAKRRSVPTTRADTDGASVRFDLGDEEGEDAWEEASQSGPSTKPNTRRNSTVETARPQPENGSELELRTRPTNSQDIPVIGTAAAAASSSLPPTSDSDLHTPHTPQTPQPPAPSPPTNEVIQKSYSTTQLPSKAEQNVPTRPRPPSRPSDLYTLTDRILNRNVSFNAPPELSSVSASVIGSAHTSPSNTRQTNAEVISRFLNGISSSGATRSSFLAHHQIQGSRGSNNSQDDDSPRKNPPVASLSRMPTGSSLSGMATPTTLWQDNLPSRAKTPPGGSQGTTRRVRMSTNVVPSFPASDNGNHSGAEDAMVDNSDLEYRRIRLFYNPLGDAIQRYQEAHQPKSQPSNKAPSKPSLVSSGSHEGRSILSTSYRSQRSTRSEKPSSVETVRSRPKVTFQGLRNKNDGDSIYRRSMDGDEEEKSPRQEVLEISKRMWNQHRQIEVGGADD